LKKWLLQERSGIAESLPELSFSDLPPYISVMFIKRLFLEIVEGVWKNHFKSGMKSIASKRLKRLIAEYFFIFLSLAWSAGNL